MVELSTLLAGSGCPKNLGEPILCDFGSAVMGDE
ncbi:hypothetical protein PDIG_73700 [Penicillium digitatum PHI26]|uniref:Uncharacterized protein n=2 Tax=Penicillium digitatum TaxID=36651 RepID=K9G1E4_PEND2|nr:hypothetical protein PDIP_44180 [Penicillium digitatum Pd1]EKV07096.1 hypothetical protein PDIG_73700 [Penicillium digitatum PHI26]EKV14374.1 hypothetical protein PDIP_44180 [Penicillium digitatum Pd1]